MSYYDYDYFCFGPAICYNVLVICFDIVGLIFNNITRNIFGYFGHFD